MTRLKSGNLPSTTLRDQFDVGEAEAHLVGEDVERDRVVGVGEQLAQFQHRLARQDHFLPRVVAVDGNAGPRQPMAVGGDGLQRALVDDQQHAVQVVADVLLRHRELGQFEELAQVLLRQ